MATRWQFETIPPGSARVYTDPEDPQAVTSDAYKWGKRHKVRIQTRVVGNDVHVWAGDVEILREGIKGVCPCTRKRRQLWEGYLYKNKTRYRKLFKTFEEAVAYRKQLEKEHHV